MDIQERIMRMRDKIERVKNYKDVELELCDDEVKAKALKIKEQTITVLNDALVKIEETGKEKTSSLELEEFIDKIEARFNEAYYYSLHRIDDIIKPETDFDESLNELKSGLSDLGKSLYTNMKNFAQDENTKESLKKLKNAAKTILTKSKEAFENKDK